MFSRSISIRSMKFSVNTKRSFATSGEKISMKNGNLFVPNHPIIPYIEGDGTGADIWKARYFILFFFKEKKNLTKYLF